MSFGRDENIGPECGIFLEKKSHATCFVCHTGFGQVAKRLCKEAKK
jgi:hypothetical protein